jgi:hypothetical protein
MSSLAAISKTGAIMSTYLTLTIYQTRCILSYPNQSVFHPHPEKTMNIHSFLLMNLILGYFNVKSL